MEKIKTESGLIKSHNSKLLPYVVDIKSPQFYWPKTVELANPKSREAGKYFCLHRKYSKRNEGMNNCKLQYNHNERLITISVFMNHASCYCQIVYVAIHTDQETSRMNRSLHKYRHKNRCRSKINCRSLNLALCSCETRRRTKIFFQRWHCVLGM
jgi:alpha-galactosidase